jgi:hypothetical protein
VGRHRQVEHIKFAAAFTSCGAPWRPGAALASRVAGDALRGAGTLCERSRKSQSVASPNWLRSRVHSGGPSSLISRPNCAPKAAMDSSSCGAHACMLGARFGVRAAEVRHLAVLSSHGCMACRVYWLTTHPMNAYDTGECAEGRPFFSSSRNDLPTVTRGDSTGVRQPTNLHQKQEPPKTGRTTDKRIKRKTGLWTNNTDKPDKLEQPAKRRQRTKPKTNIALPRTRQDR